MWFGPSAAAGALRTLVDAYTVCGLGVSVATDGTLYQMEAFAASHSPAALTTAQSRARLRPRRRTARRRHTRSRRRRRGETAPRCCCWGFGWGSMVWTRCIMRPSRCSTPSRSPSAPRADAPRPSIISSASKPISRPHHSCPAISLPPTHGAHANDDRCSLSREAYTRGGSLSPDFPRGGSLSPDFGRAGSTLRKSVLDGGAAHVHCERVRKMPLMGLNPSMLIGFVCRDEAEWINLRRRVAELPWTIFAIQDEQLKWPGAGDADEMGLERISNP
ncbi:hypothetical protein DFH09DRAFT_459655 [Mycena vulgaris]|nr:hypothetical protein DFH09DRAFT_459655 [Mycena vulgaris]